MDDNLGNQAIVGGEGGGGVRRSANSLVDSGAGDSAPAPVAAHAGSDAARARDPNAETLVKLNFTLKQHQAYRSSGIDMATTEVVSADVGIAETSMRAARDRMAKEAKVEAELLPIAVGMDEVHLEV